MKRSVNLFEKLMKNKTNQTVQYNSVVKKPFSFVAVNYIEKVKKEISEDKDSQVSPKTMNFFEEFSKSFTESVYKTSKTNELITGKPGTFSMRE